MKRILLLFVIALTFNSCTECQDCTYIQGGVTIEEEVCRDDYASNAEYQAAIIVLESEDFGAECK